MSSTDNLNNLVIVILIYIGPLRSSNQKKASQPKQTTDENSTRSPRKIPSNVVRYARRIRRLRFIDEKKSLLSEFLRTRFRKRIRTKRN